VVNTEESVTNLCAGGHREVSHELPKPTKTLADYMVIGISPVLIMLLVGSLSFFLIQVFYQGEAVEVFAGSCSGSSWPSSGTRIGNRTGHRPSCGIRIGPGGGDLALPGTIHPAYLVESSCWDCLWCAHKLTWDAP